MRVCQIVYSMDIEAEGGGITRFASTLSKSLTSHGFELVLCGLWDLGSEAGIRLKHNMEEGGIRAFTGAIWDEYHPYQSFFRAYRGVCDYIKQNPVDIVHSHSQFGDVVAMLLKIEGITPIILRTLHNGLPIEWRRKPFRRLIFSNFLFPITFNREISVSPHVTNYLNQRRLTRLIKRDAITIGNAIDLTRFHKLPADYMKVREELGIPADAFVVGTVGRLSEEKGFDLFIQAAKNICDEYNDVYFIIVGDGKLAVPLREAVEHTEIKHNVHFTGARSDIENILNTIDLFVCSSRWEGLSTAIMEAMAIGVPIVATNIPGNRDLLTDGKNAWLVPLGDIQALAEAIINARNNPDLGKKLALQAQVDVEAYDIDRVALQHGQLYGDFVK